MGSRARAKTLRSAARMAEGDPGEGAEDPPGTSGRIGGADDDSGGAGAGSRDDGSSGAPGAKVVKTGRITSTSRIEFVEEKVGEKGAKAGADDASGSGDEQDAEVGGEGQQQDVVEEEDVVEVDEGGFKVQDAIVSQVKTSRAPSVRPCRHYIDVEFTEPTEVNFLSFRNHYTAFCTVKMKVWMIDTWITLVEGEKLMANLHNEHDAQNHYILRIQSAEHDTTRIHCIRIYLSQPSPMWLHVNFTLKELTVYRSETAQEVWQYVSDKGHAVVVGGLNGVRIGGAPNGGTAEIENGGDGGGYHELDALPFNHSEDYNQVDEGEDDEDDEAGTEEEEEGGIEDELVIDEDLHRRLCKYLNIASDELDFDKERAGFGSLEPRSRTTTVRLSPP